MSAFSRYFWPDRISGQVTLVMIASLILIITIVSSFFSVLRPYHPPSRGMTEMLVLGGMLQSLNEAAPQDRPQVVAAVNREILRFHVELVDPDAPLLGIPPARLREPRVTADLENGMKILAVQPVGSDKELVAEFALADGTRVRADHLTKRGKPPFIGNPLLQILFLLTVSLALLMIWAIRTLARPLSELERAVSVFGEGPAELVPLTERGPREVRAAASAFNRMQVRIRDLIERRTRMLAAIGHDLRTPLTRLRLRLELMEDGEQKDRNLSDLSVMESQINGALNFLREGRTGEPTAPVDLPSLLLSVQDQYEDMGQDIGLTCAPDLVIQGRASELVRAVSNLIDNAHRHAGTPELRAFSRDSMVVIEVIDHGPGLSSAEKLRLMEPFERGDAARAVSDGQGAGFGLGLATARAIAEGHGGRLDLGDTPGGGLTARMQIPRAGS